MSRRSRSIGQVALLAVIAALAVPGESSALAGVEILLTASGPSPADRTLAGAQVPIWLNQDTATHTIAFADGCSFEVAPNASAAGTCEDSWSGIGTHPYTVDATFQASLTRVLSFRRVTLSSKHHGFRLGSRVRLHGSLEAVVEGAPPSLFGPQMPVMVFARPDRSHPWHRIAVVMARPFRKPRAPAHSVWQLWVRPRGSTTYVVVVNSQPQGGQLWERAQSRLFGVYARR